MSRRGQSTLEYAVLIAVVAAAVTAMQAYVRRAIQAQVKMVEEELNAATTETPGGSQTPAESGERGQPGEPEHEVTPG